MQQIFWRRLVVIGGLCSALSAGAAPVAELVVGQSLPLSGEQAALGRQLRLGADLWFAHVNATGGIQGTPIRHVVLDDAFDPPSVVRNTRQLVQQEQVSVLIGYPQAQGVRAVLAQKLLAASGVPLLGPATGPGGCASQCTPRCSLCALATRARPNTWPGTWPRWGHAVSPWCTQPTKTASVPLTPFAQHSPARDLPWPEPPPSARKDPAQL